MYAAINSNSLAQEVASWRKAFNMSAFNKCVKAQTGQPLIHSICLITAFTLDQKKEALELLLPDQNINESDRDSKTVLDHIPTDDDLYIFLRSKNALHSIAAASVKKSILKKSYDSPPASPGQNELTRRLSSTNSVTSSE